MGFSRKAAENVASYLFMAFSFCNFAGHEQNQFYIPLSTLPLHRNNIKQPSSNVGLFCSFFKLFFKRLFDFPVSSSARAIK
jgi:hypothetical protein